MKIDLSTDKNSIYFQHCESQFLLMSKIVHARVNTSVLGLLNSCNVIDALNYLHIESGSNTCRAAQDCIIVVSEYALKFGVERIFEEINEHFVYNPELKAVLKKRIEGLMDSPRRTAELKPAYKKLMM